MKAKLPQVTNYYLVPILKTVNRLLAREGLKVEILHRKPTWSTHVTLVR